MPRGDRLRKPNEINSSYEGYLKDPDELESDELDIDSDDIDINDTDESI